MAAGNILFYYTSKTHLVTADPIEMASERPVMTLPRLMLDLSAKDLGILMLNPFFRGQPRMSDQQAGQLTSSFSSGKFLEAVCGRNASDGDFAATHSWSYSTVEWP